MNQVNLIGRIGNDLNIENNCLRVSVATNERYKKDGEVITDTQWHTVVMFSPTADNFAKFFKKGDGVALTGKLKYTEKDGKYYTSIICNSWQFLPTNNVNNQSNQPNQEFKNDVKDRFESAVFDVDDSQDLPF